MAAHLDELRDKLALKIYREFFEVEPEGWEDEIEIAKKMFDALLTQLAEQAGEFDEKAAGKEERQESVRRNNRMLRQHAETATMVFHEDSDFVMGARWQFDRDRARIGIAEQVAKDNAKLWAQIEQLEARLAESERGNQELRMRLSLIISSFGMPEKNSGVLAQIAQQQASDAHRSIDSLINKLAKADARIKELEAAMIQRVGKEVTEKYRDMLKKLED
jgi:paraquat-inducible protein B